VSDRSGSNSSIRALDTGDSHPLERLSEATELSKSNDHSERGENSERKERENDESSGGRWGDINPGIHADFDGGIRGDSNDDRGDGDDIGGDHNSIEADGEALGSYMPGRPRLADAMMRRHNMVPFYTEIRDAERRYDEEKRQEKADGNSKGRHEWEHREPDALVEMSDGDGDDEMLSDCSLETRGDTAGKQTLQSKWKNLFRCWSTPRSP
jgi:hypothetical protein